MAAVPLGRLQETAQEMAPGDQDKPTIHDARTAKEELGRDLSGQDWVSGIGIGRRAGRYFGKCFC